MQMTMDQAVRPGLSAFALKRSSGYVMRSEKRPGYGGASGGGGGRKPRKPKAGIFYIIMTIIISVLVWPIGMVMLWRKKVRMQAGTKLLISLLTMCVCVFLIVFALTVHVDNEQYTAFQDKANDWLNEASAKLAVAGDAAYRQGVETWGVMTEFADNAAQPVMNTVADGMDRAVALACMARAKVQNVPIEDVTPIELMPLVPVSDAPADAAVDDDGTAVRVRIPENTPAPGDAKPLSPGTLTADGTLKPDETPEPTPTPAPTPEPTPTEEVLVWSAMDENGEPEAEATPEPEATAEPEAAETAEAEAAAPEPAPEESGEPLLAAAEVQPVEDVEATPEATAEPTPGPTAVPELTVRVKPAGEARVYYNATGKLYHMSSSCKRMSGADPHTLAEAVVAGKLHCNECGTPDESIMQEPYVAWVDANNVYHTSDACGKFVGEWRLISLNDAVNGDYAACPDCEAALYAALYATPEQAGADEAPAEDTAVEESPAEATAITAVTPSVPLKAVGDLIVYHSSNGRFYHRHEICKGMTGSSPYKLSEITSDYRRCNTCAAPDVGLVGKTCLWMDENGLCHTSDECAKFQGEYTLILRDEALSGGKTGCPDCGANEYLVPDTVLATAG